MNPRQTLFRERLAVEWQDIRRKAENALRAYDAFKESQTHPSFLLDATALNLHGFYTGLERTFEWLARQMDGAIPEGPFWHRELLVQMSRQLPGVRPQVIATSTRRLLGEYLGFRQIVRNAFTSDFEAEEVGELIARLPIVLLALDEDFERFRQFLDEIPHIEER